MNTHTNELYDLDKMSDEECKELDDKLIAIPPALQKAASLKLNGNKYAVVSKTSGGKLSKFAAKERVKRKKAKKQQKNNRKNNR